MPDNGIIDEVWLSVAWNHTWIGDLIIGLQSPTGARLTMLNRPGVPPNSVGDSSDILAAFPISFRDGAPNDAETMGNTLPSSAAVVCRDDGRCSCFPNPGGYPTSTLTNFAGFAGGRVLMARWRLRNRGQR